MAVWQHGAPCKSGSFAVVAAAVSPQKKVVLVAVAAEIMLSAAASMKLTCFSAFRISPIFLLHAVFFCFPPVKHLRDARSNPCWLGCFWFLLLYFLFCLLYDFFWHWTSLPLSIGGSKGICQGSLNAFWLKERFQPHCHWHYFHFWLCNLHIKMPGSLLSDCHCTGPVCLSLCQVLHLRSRVKIKNHE